MAAILATPIIIGRPDIPRWKLSRSGDFSLATTWETTRSRGPIILGLADVWEAGLTASISIFIWRLLSNRIPVDTKLQWRKMELASKCQCCLSRPAIESLQHLFIQGEGANKVWREFDSWFTGASPPLRLNDTIPERIEIWSRRSQQPGKRHLSRAMPYLVLWFLWAERNRSRHQSVQFKAYNVVWQVQMFIQNSLASGKMKPKHWKGVHMRIAVPSHADIRRPRPLVMPIKWNPPDEPWIKLNTDGAFVEETGKAGGGGIVRDHEGKVLAAFATPLEAHSALEAELLAIHQGLVLASEFRLTIWVESHAAQAVRLLNGPDWGPANLCRAMAFLANHKSNLTIRASFIHREGNKPADLLAKMGLNGDEYQRMHGGSLPRLLKAMVRLDVMGVPNIRVQQEEDQDPFR